MKRINPLSNNVESIVKKEKYVCLITVRKFKLSNFEGTFAAVSSHLAIELSFP